MSYICTYKTVHSAFTTVKRVAKFKTRYVKEVSFVYRRYRNGLTFLSKMVHKRTKRVRGWTAGWSLPI